MNFKITHVRTFTALINYLVKKILSQTSSLKLHKNEAAVVKKCKRN